jgi:hypothetical protein
VSYGAPLRQRIEALVAGEYGNTRTITSGRFHRKAPDARTLEQHPHSACERAFEVIIGRRKPIAPVNPLHSTAIYEHPLTIRVAYALTDAGGDLAETLVEQDGPGTIEAARDRADTDAHDIAAVVCWYENYAGLTPDVFDIHETDDGHEETLDDDRLIVEIRLALRLEATVYGAGYAP